MAEPRKIPKVVANVDIRTLPISAVEGYVLSQVDGVTDLDDLALLMGMPVEILEDHLIRIEALGAVEWVVVQPAGARRPSSPAMPVAPNPPAAAAPPSPKPPAPATPVAREPASVERPFEGRPARVERPVAPVAPNVAERPERPEAAPERPAPAPTANAEKPPASPPPARPGGASVRGIEPIDPNEVVDLDEDRKRLIVSTYDSLEQLDFYELLRVAPTADKSDVKASYFQLSKIFHPDTAYGKRLGSYKGRMEAVFKRITEAYDTLSKSKRRAEYDAELKRQGKVSKPQVPLAGEASRSAVAVPASPPPMGSTSAGASPEGSTAKPPHAAEPSRPQVPIPPAKAPVGSSLRPPVVHGSTLRAPTVASRPDPSAAPTPGTRSTATPPPGTPPAAAAPRAPSVGAPGPGSDPPVGPSPQESRRPGAEQMLRGLTAGLRSGGVQRPSPVEQGADRYVSEARRSEAEGNLIGAVNALRLAKQLAPDRVDVQAEHDRVSRALAAATAGQNAAQAPLEERAGKWASASLAWGKVCDGRPGDLRAHRHAAQALLNANGDLRRARSYAQRAIEIDPQSVESRVLLGRIYIAAGMKLNAQRELEAAAKLDPQDQIVKNLLRELKA